MDKADVGVPLPLRPLASLLPAVPGSRWAGVQGSTLEPQERLSRHRHVGLFTERVDKCVPISVTPTGHVGGDRATCRHMDLPSRQGVLRGQAPGPAVPCHLSTRSARELALPSTSFSSQGTD